MAGRLTCILVAAGCLVGFPAPALAATTTIDFEQYPEGTVLSDHYAAEGGAGQGVVFGPLPPGAPPEGFHPVIRVPPAGQAQSGSQVADIANCFACEFFTPRTTATFAVARSQVSVHVGYLGEPGPCTSIDPNAVTCALVTLRAFDVNGAQLAESSVSVARGAGVKTRLSVSTPTAAIAGIEITGRPTIDDSKPIAIDDLTFGEPAPPACEQVATAKELVDALAAGFTCVFVTGVIDLPKDLAGLVVPPHLTDAESALVIPDGVTLMGGRSPTQAGGMLVMSEQSDRIQMLSVGLGSRITGLRLKGYNELDTKDRHDPTVAVHLRSGGVLIDNNEIFGWPAAGVEVANTADQASAPLITQNYIHNNVQCNNGYGVVTERRRVDDAGNVISEAGFAVIERNVFAFNRHQIASSGGVGDGDISGGPPGPGYIARRNFSLQTSPTCGGFYNQHFDIHGDGKNGYGGKAGTLIEIRHNTFRGAQKYAFAGRLTRPAFELRGTPADKAIFSDNVVAHRYALNQHRVLGETATSKGAVRIEGASGISLLTKKKLVIKGNKTCVDAARELAVGDFNGDGRDDVFQAVGTLWVYSPSGQREWFFLNDSDLRLSKLGIGDFDGDGKSDVFFRQGDAGSCRTAERAPPCRCPSVRRSTSRISASAISTATGAPTSSGRPARASSTPAGAQRPGYPRPPCPSRSTTCASATSTATAEPTSSASRRTSGRSPTARARTGAGSTPSCPRSSQASSSRTSTATARPTSRRSHDGRWQISSGGATPWQTLAPAPLRTPVGGHAVRRFQRRRSRRCPPARKGRRAERVRHRRVSRLRPVEARIARGRPAVTPLVDRRHALSRRADLVSGPVPGRDISSLDRARAGRQHRFDQPLGRRYAQAHGCAPIVEVMRCHRVLLDRVSGYADEASAYLRRRRSDDDPDLLDPGVDRLPFAPRGSARTGR